MNLKTPFFTRKRLAVTAIVILGLYISIWVFVLAENHVDHVKRTNQLKAKQAQFNSLSKEEQASRKAQAYFKSKVDYLQPSERLFIDYLQRKFKLDAKLGVGQSPFHVSEDPRIYPQDINYLYRMAYPDSLVTRLPKDKFEGPTLTNVFASNCDHLPLPSNFWQTMEDNYKAGGYNLTHDALALAFMKDNQCTIPVKEIDLANRVTTGMVDLANDEGIDPDLRYEAVAFLQLSGHHQLIQPEWMHQIASEQKDDGSWGQKGKEDKSSYHASLLALWALLEYNNPTAPYEPLIHRPVAQQ